MDVYEIMVCPMCKSSLRVIGDNNMECCECRRVYESSDGIFNMMPDNLRYRSYFQDEAWGYWKRMQSIYKDWVKTDWSSEAAKAEYNLYDNFMRMLLTKVGCPKCILDLGGGTGV